MNPNDPNQTPPAFDPNQYDFITNPQQPAKKSLIPNIGGGGGGTPGGGGGGKSRMLIMIVAGLGILTVIILLASALFSGGGGGKDQMLSIAREQTVLLAVAKTGQEKGGSTDTKSLANSVALTVATDQKALIDNLAKNGTKIKEKDVAGVPSAEITQKLTVAEQNGTFDVAFESTIKELLAAYQTNLRLAFESSNSKSAKETYTTSFDNTALLIEDAENNK